jgi:hypothetical protein
MSSKLTFCAVLLSLGLVSVVAADAGEISPSKGSLLLFGSSSVNDTFGHLMSEEFERLGFVVARHGFGSAGLARPDFRDLREALDQVPIERELSAVVFYVGANDAQKLWLRPEERAPNASEEAAWVEWEDERWSSVYVSRVAELIHSVCARGAKRAILLAPVDVTSSMRQARLDRIRQLQAHAAALSECGYFVPTSGDSAEFAHRNTQPLRTEDGYHMTRSGAFRVWERVRPTVLSLLAKCGPNAPQSEGLLGQ